MKAYLLALSTLIVLMAPAAWAERIVAARYAEPVERYGHFALGRPHEYACLIATTDAGRDLGLELPGDEVFEDLAPHAVEADEETNPAAVDFLGSQAVVLIKADTPQPGRHGRERHRGENPRYQ